MGIDCPQIRIYNMILASLASWRIDPFDSLSFVRARVCVRTCMPAYDNAVGYVYLFNTDEKRMPMAYEDE
jgi:hypothetical protein